MSDSAMYKKIIDYLKKEIDEHKNIPNYILPSERLLSMKFNVSRNPVRKAYEQLYMQNYVERVHGKGYLIKNQSGNMAAPLSGRPLKINFITPDITTVFMQEILSGIEKFCDKIGLDLSIENSNLKTNKEKHLIQSAVMSNSSGIILFPVDGEHYNEELVKLSISKFPIAVIDRYFTNLNIPYVGTDNYAAMVDAVKFLHQKKYKHFVYISSAPSLASSVAERINGYNYGLIKYYGSSNARDLLKIPTNKQSQINAIKDYLKNYPDTELLIFTGSQFVEVMQALSASGVSVPKDIRLMIFDDELSVTEKNLLHPYLINQDAVSIGYFAAKILYDQIYTSAKPISKTFPVKITET